MTEPQILTQILESCAEHAPTVRPDLVEVVDQRYHRRRRVRTVGSAAAAVLVVAVVAVAAALHPVAGTTGKPPTSADGTQDRSWTIPPANASVPSITAVWPNAVVQAPANTPNGGDTQIHGAIDATHLLVSGGDAFYAYDTVHRTFRMLVANFDDGGRPTSLVGVTPRWIVWSLIDDADHPASGSQVYKAPTGGGAPRLIADLPGTTGQGTAWFLTDAAAYWSDHGPGVTELSLSGGPPRALAGFGDYMVTASSPWAISTTKASLAAVPTSEIPGQDNTVTNGLKNILTGELRDVTTAPRTKRLACSPAFCIGANADGRFIQSLDGSRVVALPGDATIDRPLVLPTVGRAGLFIFERISYDTNPIVMVQYLYDPISGAYAQLGGSTLIPDGGITLGPSPVMIWISDSTNAQTVLMLNDIH